MKISSTLCYKPFRKVFFKNKNVFKADSFIHNAKNDSFEKLNYYFPNIAFKGNFVEQNNFEDDFNSTIEKKYFQLPKITLKDGTIHQIEPDESQIECAKELYEGNSVVFCAPTGMGKTAIAHYCATNNLSKGKRTLYTVPIKALANDKYDEFCKIYGANNVGILTGDRKINPNAPIVIMTCEIFDNQSSNFDDNNSDDIQNDIETVIFDEAHYISDPQRGSVWEYSILNSALKNIQVLCLSATIGNSEHFCDWINGLNNSYETKKVEIMPQNRPVPLIWNLYDKNRQNSFSPLIKSKVIFDDYPTQRQKEALAVLYREKHDKNQFYKLDEKEYQKTFDELKPLVLKNQQINNEITTDEFQNILKENYPNLSSTKIKLIAQFMADDDSKEIIAIKPKGKNELCDLIKDMKKGDYLPAIFFKLSQQACEDKLFEVQQSGIDLLNDEEKKKIQEILDEYKEKNVYLGHDFDPSMLLKGFCVHHAGKLPQYKKLIEELFSKKLLKVVFATSTLGAGINMPARSVVISDTTYQAYNPETKSLETKPLSANEFHQMAGRAGRRGIDEIGNVILFNLYTTNNQNRENQRQDELELAYSLINSPPDDLRSQFHPDAPIMALNIKNNRDIRDLINKSFKMYVAKQTCNLDDFLRREESLYKKFENYKKMLLKGGYIWQMSKNGFQLSPKGEILSKSQGMNPLLFCDMLYEESLDNLDEKGLSALCAMMGNANLEEETKEQTQNVESVLKQYCNDKNFLGDFDDIIKMTKAKEAKITRGLFEARVNKSEISYSDSFCAMVLYLWADLNQKNDNSIENFENLIKIINDSSLSKDEIKRKTTLGNIYKIIAQSISNLKQIIRICDYALANPDTFSNEKYWQDLELSALCAIELIQKEPINNEKDYENKLSNI